MEKIVIMSRDMGVDGALPGYLVPLLACVRALFPECEIQMVSRPPEGLKEPLGLRNGAGEYR